MPHIYAPTVEAGLYAQGWAQAEDRPTQLLLNLKIALGELTEIKGEEAVQTSLISHMFGHMRNATRSEAPKDTHDANHTENTLPGQQREALQSTHVSQPRAKPVGAMHASPL